jgi:DNA helicase-2/ATP-dependent DNA helicase PcrA
LVLASNKRGGAWKDPSNAFSEMYEKLPDNINLDKFDFEKIKDVDLKSTYAFTTNINVYETCAVQYKFFKELSFKPVRVGATVFGQLVHETIEDIHKCVLKKEIYKIDNDNIEQWFRLNYESISKKEHYYLQPQILEVALNQVKSYVKRKENEWHKIKEVEIPISVVKEDYILTGKIDLIQGDGNTFEILDFKSEKKPDMFKDRDKLNRSKKQLELYAHIVEERFGVKVSKMHIYYTSESEGNPYISFKYDKQVIDNTLNSIDKVIRKIESKDFSLKTSDIKVCKNCDMRFYCKKYKE